MRIVLISEVFARNMGYLENVLPRYLARLGAEVDVLASSLPPNYRQDPRQETYRNFQDPVSPGSIEAIDGFRLHVLGHKQTFGHVRLRGLRRKLEELRPQIVQIMTPIGWIAIDAALHRLRSGYRLFSGCHYHASVFPLAQAELAPLSRERLRCLAERGLHGRMVSWLTEKCYAIAPDCAEVAARFFGVPRGKLEICPLGVDTELFHPVSDRDEAEARKQLRGRFGFWEEDIVCVYSGRFTPDKNPLCLARAVAERNRDGEPFRGLFIGQGTQGEEIARCPGCAVQPFVPVGSFPRFIAPRTLPSGPPRRACRCLTPPLAACPSSPTTAWARPSGWRDAASHTSSAMPAIWQQNSGHCAVRKSVSGLGPTAHGG